MNRSDVLVEDGVITGNIENKYAPKNPVVRRIMDGFFNSADAFVDRVNPETIHEVGCGEGHLSSRWVRPDREIRGSDFSAQIIDIARHNAEQYELPIAYEVKSVYDLVPEQDAAEMIVCCEVLEHLERPRDALRVLRSLAKPWLLTSVPREPLWCALNMARGKYLSDLGNTPGHIQHWSKIEFLTFLSSEFEVVEVASPIPWTMALCRVRQ